MCYGEGVGGEVESRYGAQAVAAQVQSAHQGGSGGGGAAARAAPATTTTPSSSVGGSQPANVPVPYKGRGNGGPAGNMGLLLVLVVLLQGGAPVPPGLHNSHASG